MRSTRFPDASYAVTRAEPAASADRSSRAVTGFCFAAGPVATGSRVAASALTSAAGTVITRSWSRVVTSEAVSGSSATTETPSAPSPSALSSSALSGTRTVAPGGTETGVRPFGVKLVSAVITLTWARTTLSLGLASWRVR